MQTELALKFRIPEDVLAVLKIVRKQTKFFEFDLDEKIPSIKLYTDLRDYPFYTDDVDDISCFEDEVLEGLK